jgi:predicted RNase H-like HicB family nuclease
MLETLLTGYIESGLSKAEYDKFEDDTFSGRIPGCKGVIAFANSLRECESELQTTLEDWVLVDLKLGPRLPVIDGYDLNKEPTDESVAAM